MDGMLGYVGEELGHCMDGRLESRGYGVGGICICIDYSLLGLIVLVIGYR